MKTKILFRIRSMEMGGVQKVLIDILKHLDREKFQVCVLLNIAQGTLLAELPKDIPVISLQKGKEAAPKNALLQKFWLVKRRAKLYFHQKNPEIVRKMLPFVPDVEVAMFHYNYAEMLRSPFKNSKKVGWYHAGISEFKGQLDTDKVIAELKQCDMTVHVSQNTLNDVIRHSGNSLTNGIVIHNAFDINKIRKLAKKQTIDLKLENLFVSVGRLASQKGYDILLEAHKKLIDAGIAHHIAVIGGGDDLEKLASRTKELGVEKSFLLLGEKQNPFPYIKAADFYIQPSRYEAYPLALGEAMILGKAAVATDVGGVNEMMKHEETGYIVPLSEQGLAEGIKTFLSNPNMVKNIEKNVAEIDFKAKNREIRYSIDFLMTR